MAKKTAGAKSPATDKKNSPAGGAKGKENPSAKSAQPAPKKSLKEQMDYRRSQLLVDHAAAYDEVRLAETRVGETKADLKSANADLELAEKRLHSIGRELSEIQTGRWHPRLPFTGPIDNKPHPDVEAGKNRPHGTPALNAAAGAVREAEAGQDGALGLNLDVLTKKELTKLVKEKYPDQIGQGLSPTEVELIKAGLEIETVGELEREMRKDRNWYLRLKGFGETKREKLTLAHAALRKVYPWVDPAVPAKSEENPPAANPADSKGAAADSPASEEGKKEPAKKSAKKKTPQ